MIFDLILAALVLPMMPFVYREVCKMYADGMKPTKVSTSTFGCTFDKTDWA